MYSVVLLLATTTTLESTQCQRRFRDRHCYQAPCCPLPWWGVMPPVPDYFPAPVTASPKSEAPKTDVIPAVTAGPLTPAEEQQLAELLGILKNKISPNELKVYENYFRGISPAKRAEEYRQIKAISLTPEEERMLKELLEKFGTKDKEGKVKYSTKKSLMDYEQWFREQTPADRLKEYNREIKGKAPTGPEKQSQLDAPGQILVYLPADARLTFNGQATRAISDRRFFESPPLSAQGLYFYEMRATFERGGMPIQINRLVRVRAGEATEVFIEDSTAVNVPSSRR